jgi:mRNA interferase MazF
MRRGEIWTVSGGKDYPGKPRPVVIVQDDAFDATDSITICAAITTVPKSKAGERIGRLDDEDVVRLNQAVMVFLGLAVSPRTGRKRQR